MNKICFIILHYIAVEETLVCIESIKKMNNQEEIQVIIVDNASPDDSVQILESRYANDRQVDIICMEENEGLSEANNRAYQYAEEQYHSRFYVFTNNDIIFEQENFPELVEQEYAHSNFAVMGMDIYSARRKIHQSPLAREIPRLKTINKTICMNRVALFLFPLCYPLLKTYYEKELSRGIDAVSYNEYQSNVCLMGACIVMESAFLKRRKVAFCPNTYFYYEEYLLALRCKREQALIIYNPEIHVLHTDGAATQKSFSYGRDRIRFQMRCIMDAAEIYKKELLKSNSGT